MVAYRSLLSHFPSQLKPGKNAILPEEPQGDSQGRLDTVSSIPAKAGELSNGTFRSSQARWDRSPSVGEAVGVSASERCRAPIQNGSLANRLPSLS